MNKNKQYKEHKTWIGGKHSVLHALKNEKNTIYNIALSSKKNLNLIPKHLLGLVKIKIRREIKKDVKRKIR